MIEFNVGQGWHETLCGGHSSEASIFFNAGDCDSIPNVEGEDELKDYAFKSPYTSGCNVVVRNGSVIVGTNHVYFLRFISRVGKLTMPS